MGDAGEAPPPVEPPPAESNPQEAEELAAEVSLCREMQRFLLSKRTVPQRTVPRSEQSLLSFP